MAELPCQTEAIDVSKLRRDVLPIFLGRLEAPLLHCLESLFIKAGTTALDDLRLGHFSLRIDLDSQRHVTLDPHAQRQGRICGARRLYGLCFSIGFEDAGRAGASAETGIRRAAASARCPASWNYSNITFVKKTTCSRF